ncbi:MAG: PD40 domain-containing protein [Anaerolineae bacterium]|nr:PD40 domain-containing protein [Anaerolineae bacterium]
MSTNEKRLLRAGLAIVFLVGAVLACAPTCQGAVSVAINSPPDGSAVVVGQEVLIDSTSTAGAGVARVELSVGGVVVRRDVPPSGSPATFRVSQPWTPATEGQAMVSVVAYDVSGNSSNVASITLQVVASGGVVPTTAPGATAAPPVTGPTETPPPPVTTEAGCTLGSQYVADVTIPDNTVFAPGASFVKTWRVRNSGTCDWDAGFQLVFVSGEQMGGPAGVTLPAVPAGGQTDISVNLTAPSAYGTYKGTWRLRSDEGMVFGTNLTVLIVVPAPATDTPVPTEVPTAEPTPFGGGSGRIAYVSFRDGNAEIYVMVGNDTAPTRLTNNSELDDWPDWSFDGSKIAFSRYSGGKPDVFVMNADGSSQVNLTNNPAWDSRPSWSPDGSKIAFESNRVGDVIQIWVMNAGGSGATQLTSTGLNSGPSWSPGGNRIAFESNRDGQREIYVMNADGSGQTRLTFTGSNYGPKWSPDGNWLVFSSSDGIWKMKRDGTNLMQLTTNSGPSIYDAHPSWSPDSTLILFDSKRDGNSDLWVVKPDGTGLQKLTTSSAHDLNSDWR